MKEIPAGRPTAVLMTPPMLVPFPFLQRTFIAGITAGVVE
jgi:ABC-type glycerol-3-phosphate transport system permease component